MNASKRFLFVGGGTGGHLTPALGLAEALQARGHETMFLTSGRAVEQEFLGQAGTCRSLGIDGSLWPGRTALIPGCFRAWRQARSFAPDCVISLGGACGFTAVFARNGSPMIALEGNRVVGRAVRMLQPFATRTLTMFPDTVADLHNGICVGPLGRNALQDWSLQNARAHFHLPESGPLLLVMGESQGALQLNRFVASVAPRLAEGGASLLALAGPGNSEALRDACREANLTATVMDHCTEMGAAYAAADLALSRGGASTIAELWTRRLPSIIVPYPWHKDRHQEQNAQAMGDGSKILNDLNQDAADLLVNLVFDVDTRLHMEAQLEVSAPVDGLPKAVQLLEEFATSKA